MFKGITGNVLILGLVSFFTDVSSEMIYPLLPLFLTTVLGVGPAFLGLIEGVAESTAAFLKLASGMLSDRVRSRKGLLVAGYAVSSLVRPLVAIATLLLARFVDDLRTVFWLAAIPWGWLCSSLSPRFGRRSTFTSLTAVFSILPLTASFGAISSFFSCSPSATPPMPFSSCVRGS